MRRLSSLLALVLVLGAAAPPANATVLRINEVVANHVGTDSHEYVEIFFQSGNYDLSGFSILQIEGDGSGAGTVDGVYAAGTTNAGGYWTTGYLNNMIENGTITLLLVNSFTGTVGDDLDTDNDGTLDSQPWYLGLEYDAVAISDGGASDRTYAATVLTPSFDGGVFTPGGASLIPDAGATWVRNDFDGRGLPGFAGTPATGEALNTPAAENALWIPPADPVINEWLANHTGADAHEFVEVYGLADTDYSHLTLIAVEGDGASAGIIDAIYTVGTTDANGFWDNYPLAADALENGTNTFILGEGFFGSVGQDLDTNNDGVLETSPFVRVVDDVAVTDGTVGDDAYSATVLASNYDGVAGEPGGASRIPNGTDTDTATDWMRNDFDGDGLTGFTGTPVLTEARNTPGTKNLTAIDTEPPVITIDPDRSVLWPPNHRLIEVCITVTVSDEREPAPTYVLTSVTSNEVDDGKGDGHTQYDIRDAVTGTGDLCFLLRSERSGGGDGREYTIVYTATDGAGNTSTGTAVVTVPHDQYGAALASAGFAPDGASFGAGAGEFALVIPSTVRMVDGSGVSVSESIDATQIDPHLAYVGNGIGVVRPVRSDVQEVTGDGLDDLVLYYNVDAAVGLDPRRGRFEGDAMLALHFESPDGTQLFVESIFELGTPVSLVGGVPIDPDGALRVALNDLAIQPNPFNPQTTVTVEMPVAGHASVRVFDVRGALVRTLQNGGLAAGRHDIRWDGRDNAGRAVASGVYFVSFQAGDVRLVKRAVLLK